MADHRAGLMARYGRWLIILPPLVFLLVFFLIPFGFALKISFGEAALRIPPFTDLMGRGADGHWVWQGTWASYRYLLTDDVYIVSLLYSVRTAFFATLLCLLVGYPMAYAMSRASRSTQNILMMVIILPFWTSFLLRVYALESLIRDNGLVNAVLLQWGIIDHPLRMMHTTFAIYLGIVYSYLPFMVLPLYATLEKLDRTLLEAAADLVEDTAARHGGEGDVDGVIDGVTGGLIGGEGADVKEEIEVGGLRELGGCPEAAA